MKRRLAAILVSDVVGYSAMMEADEEGTATRIGDIASTMQEKVVIAKRSNTCARFRSKLDARDFIRSQRGWRWARPSTPESSLAARWPRNPI
jgi:hypothetical protein